MSTRNLPGVKARPAFKAKLRRHTTLWDITACYINRFTFFLFFCCSEHCEMTNSANLIGSGEHWGRNSSDSGLMQQNRLIQIWKCRTETAQKVVTRISGRREELSSYSVLLQECEYRISPGEPCGLHQEEAAGVSTWPHTLAALEKMPLCKEGDAVGELQQADLSVFWINHTRYSPLHFLFQMESNTSTVNPS
jgi:hypothetical protein